ncbi:MAG: SUMF1/EgtB/PvdO family nonheme iron enzyme [Planctomycetota bacterium]
MARIEARSVRVESEYGFARKARNGKVKTFFIDLCEVTHGSYWRDFYATLDDAAQKATFLPRDENDAPIWFQEPTSGEFQPDPSLMNLPVTGIDAVAALAYAKKQGKRLPTEAEWLAAAAGHKSRATDYAWGDDFDPMRCNAKESGVGAAVAVTDLPVGRSHFGLYHVCGNVKEWTATTEEGKDFDDAVPAGEALAIRGGSYKETARNVSLKWRWVLPGTGSRLTDVGFRCAKDVF